MAMALKESPEVLPLAKRAVGLVQDLGEDGDSLEQQELSEKRQDAERALSTKSPAEALKVCVMALEQMLVAGISVQIIGNTAADGQIMGNSVAITGKKAHLIRARLREILWVAKDAQGFLRDMGDQVGRACALKALARVHLSRSDELDAPMAAQRAAKDAVKAFHDADEPALEAEALLTLSEAHLIKATLSPYEKVVAEERDRAVQATRQAASIFKKLDDKKGEGRALHSMATVLLRSDDEDEQLDAEWHIQESIELFRGIKAWDLECNSLMTMVSARIATSGPEQAALFAKDTAADFRREGTRAKHEAMALHAAAEVHLSLQQLDEAKEHCKEAYRIFNRASNKRGCAGVLQTLFQIASAKGDLSQAMQAGEEAVAAFQDADDRRGEGSILAALADTILTKLSTEVAQDTDAASAKQDPVNGLTPDEVSRRADQGLDFANRAFGAYEEVGDQQGMAEVQNVIQACFQKTVDVYCANTEPDRIYTTLEVDGPKEKESVLEWSVEFPHAKRLIMTS